jgi:peptidoglycan-associated lipoprotein
MPRGSGALRVPLFLSCHGLAIASVTFAVFTGVAVAQSRDVHVGPLRWPAASDGSRSSDVERQARRLLQDARTSLDVGNTLDGRRRLEILVARYPDTGVADEARMHLSRLYAEPGRNMAKLGTMRPPLEPVSASGGMAETRPVTQPKPAEPRYAVTAEWDFRIAAGDRVFFGDGSADLGSSARTVLAAQARWLKENPDLLIFVEGHADEQGSDSANADLALRRAEAVRARLVESGIDMRRIVVETRGRVDPVALCKAPDCAVQNRRVVTRLSAARTPNAMPVRQSRVGAPGGN